MTPLAVALETFYSEADQTNLTELAARLVELESALPHLHDISADLAAISALPLIACQVALRRPPLNCAGYRDAHGTTQHECNAPAGSSAFAIYWTRP